MPGDRETLCSTVGLQAWAGAVAGKREEGVSSTYILEAKPVRLVKGGECEAKLSPESCLCTLEVLRPPNSPPQGDPISPIL